MFARFHAPKATATPIPDCQPTSSLPRLPIETGRVGDMQVMKVPGFYLALF